MRRAPAWLVAVLALAACEKRGRNGAAADPSLDSGPPGFCPHGARFRSEGASEFCVDSAGKKHGPDVMYRDVLTDAGRRIPVYTFHYVHGGLVRAAFYHRDGKTKEQEQEMLPTEGMPAFLDHGLGRWWDEQGRLRRITCFVNGVEQWEVHSEDEAARRGCLSSGPRRDGDGGQ